MPRGPRKFDFAFVKSGLTRFGGLSLFQSFCRSFAIRRFLQTYVRWPDYAYRDFHPVDLFLAHLFSIVAGLGRIENTQSLIHNGLIPPLLGLNDFPHRDTLRTFLLRFEPNSLRSCRSPMTNFGSSSWPAWAFFTAPSSMPIPPLSRPLDRNKV